MSERKLRLFMNQRGNRALILCISLTVAIGAVCPFVSGYFDARAMRLESDDIALQLDDLTVAVEQLTTEKNVATERAIALRNLVVGEEHAEDFRNEIMDIVRTSDCRLRNLQIGNGSERRWMEEDDAVANNYRRDAKAIHAASTPYMLQTMELDLVVTGTFVNVQRLLETVHSMERLIHTRSLDIQNGHGAEIRVHWSLGLFNLKHAPKTALELGPEPPPE